MNQGDRLWLRNTEPSPTGWPKHGTGCAAFPVRSRDGCQRGDGARRIYLDLIKASGLDVAIRKHVRVAGEQGWLDLQMIVALIVLNLVGGGLEDLERLEQDAGFVQVMREVERRLLPRADRRALP